MPITSSEVVDGPNIQADGQRKGVIDFTFDDGRVVRRVIRAADAAAWASLLIDLEDIVEEKLQVDDAEEASEADNEITAVKQANIKQVALAYLRKAYSIGNPYLAYLKFSRFNDYRLAQGWSLTQVVAGLAEVGLEQEEWNEMLARYQYLSQTARVTAMEAYQGVVTGDTWGEEFR